MGVKGYLQFPEPLTEAELNHEIIQLKDDCLTGLFALSQLQRYKDENPDPPCVLGHSFISFSKIISTLNNNIKNPTDLEKVISDPDFFNNFKQLIMGIRKSGILDVAEDFLKTAHLRKDKANVSRVNGLIKEVKDGLLQADIYIASHLG